MSWLRFCLICCALVAGTATAAAEPARSFSLDYSANPSCPSMQEFVQAVHRRTPGAALVAAERADVRFGAQVVGEVSQSIGYLSVESEGRLSRREVPAAPCQEVVESMAVIISLIVSGQEPAASPAPPAVHVPPEPEPTLPPAAAAAPSPPTATVPPLEPDQASPTASTPPRPAPASTPRPTPLAPTSPSPLRPPPTKSSGAERWRPGLVGGVFAQHAMAPKIAPGVMGGMDLWYSRAHIFSPSVRLSLRYNPTFAVGTIARFRLLTGRLSSCPVRLGLGWLQLLPCGVFEFGRLHAEPVQAEGTPREVSMPWWGGGIGSLLQAQVADVVTLEASGALVVMGRKDRFVLEPRDQEVHEIPAVAGSLGLGAMFRWP